MVAYIPVLLIIVGLLMYALCASAKLQECGRLMFFAGLLALALSTAGQTVHLLR